MVNTSDAIAMNNVVKTFNNRRIVDNVHLAVKNNEILSIIGPSGAGKTTLLRIIAGLESYETGDVVVNGKVGMVFQHAHLWPHKTVTNNVAEALVKVKKLSRREAAEKAVAMLDYLGLNYVLNSFPDELSGGEAKRVAIARTLVMEPDVLLLDEVTSSLDPELVGEVLNALRKLAREKRTLVIVTHEMKFAREVSDRVVFFEAGKIIEEGHPHKIFSNPENERVRRFTNIIAR